MIASVLRWWRGRSLRTRITLTVGVVAVLALAAVVRAGASLFVTGVGASSDAALREQATTAAAAVRAGQAGGLPASVRVVDTAGAPVDGRPAAPVGGDAVARLAAGEAVTVSSDAGPLRWVAVPAVDPDGATRLVLCSRDLVTTTSLAAGAVPGLVTTALIGVVLVVSVTWLAVGAVLRPVERMRAAAGRLGPGERLPTPPATDELSALSGQINALLARRDDAVTRLERFTDDAAHELRTPLAALRAQADVAVAHPDAEPAADTWNSVAHEAARLTEPVNDLLALARADAGERLPGRPVDLVAAAHEAAERFRARDGPVCTVWAPVPACVASTPAETALVLDNLVTNAGRHAATVVHVSVVPAGRWVRLLVDDDGPGVPEAERARVFDRFTRLDPSAGEGAGLGLALVARLVEGRGGAVRAGASPDGGARFSVRWPALG